MLKNFESMIASQFNFQEDIQFEKDQKIYNKYCMIFRIRNKTNQNHFA